MKVRLGQSLISNLERRGNDGSTRWSGPSLLSFLHHPFKLGHFVISRENKDGKNVSFEEQNTLLTLSSDMYSSASILTRRIELRQGS